MLTIDMTREQFEDTLTVIAIDHLRIGCDDTCEFYRRDLCDAVPIQCSWVTACGALQADRKRIAKLREKRMNKMDKLKESIKELICDGLCDICPHLDKKDYVCTNGITLMELRDIYLEAEEGNSES